ncbi:hypothetical protein EJ04DRAFT_518654 [Polyplosphaeria fusca]|uniref:Probable double zinc ribbon domain-containing protein n=1 Tax=Polyplosphaeria fusca TaxID=682080 RepID=A0A9P4R6U1_9PLEO|nr:hypothetical protein EJ04DRAFT_518654 [Polyplosphaeria fusca]
MFEYPPGAKNGLSAPDVSSAATAASTHPDQQVYNIDGFWTCSTCSARNTLLYRAGEHPFAQMRCKAPHCDQIWNLQCQTTSVIRRFASKAGDPVAVPALDGLHKQPEHIPYFCMCSGCGQTWRAQKATKIQKLKAKVYKDRRASDGVEGDVQIPEQRLLRFEGTECACGAVQDADTWPRFSIRHDPAFRLGDAASVYYYLPREE